MSFNKTLNRTGLVVILGVLATGFGWGGASWYQARVKKATQSTLHRHIAALRTHEEGYALRNGHYLLLGDSCSAAGAEAWTKLGLPRPPKDDGCFKVESNTPGWSDAASSPTLRIVAVSPRGDLTGRETENDAKPTWTVRKE